MGIPKRCVEPTATSAPISPGGLRSVSASGSAATTAIAFASCNLAIEIVEVAGDAWVSKKRAEDLVWLQVFEGISDNDPPTKWLRARARHGDRLRQAIFIDKVSCRLRLRDAMGKRHPLCRRRRLVEQRSVGDSEPG